MTNLTWAELDPKLKRMLKTTDDVQYVPALRLDAVNAALRALSAHTAKSAFTELTGDGSTQQWALPGTLQTYDAFEGVFDVDKTDWLEIVRFVPGTGGGTNFRQSEILPGYYIWPQDTFNMTYAPKGKLQVYYYTYWPELVDETSIVEAPLWAENAILQYASAWCIAPGGISAARIRQFNTKVDSGNPEDNPVLQMANWHMAQYESELRRWTPQQRGMFFTPGRAK